MSDLSLATEQFSLFETAIKWQKQYKQYEEPEKAFEAIVSYINCLESIFSSNLKEQYIRYSNMVHNLNESDLDFDILDLNEDSDIISDTVSKRLDRLNFKYADTKEIIYKREGKYKYLTKYLNDLKQLKFKIFDKDEVILEKKYDISSKQKVNIVFDYIENIIKRYED